MPEMRDRIDRLHIAAPCPMSWEQMQGDDRTRFCESCNLHVYNISEMTRKQAGALIASTEGRFCAKLYRRADGTVLTKDCPVGLRALRRRASKIAGATVTALFSLCMSVMGQQASQADKQSANGGAVKIQGIGGGQSQDNKGALTGVVKDPNGAVVVGAAVALTNENTRQKLETVTDDEGLYRFSSLEAGSYTIVVSAAGFQTSRVGAVTVRGGVTNDGSVLLGVGSGAVVGLIEIDPEFDLSDATLGNKTIFPARKITSLPF